MDDEADDLVPEGYWEALGKLMDAAPVLEDADIELPEPLL